MKFNNWQSRALTAAAFLLALPIGSIALSRTSAAPVPAVVARVAPQAASAVQSAKVQKVTAQQPTPTAIEPNDPNDPADGNDAADNGKDNETNDGTQQDSSITGSIPAPAESSTEIDDAKEQVALQGLARITPQQASAVATAANAGTTVTKVELGSEDGFVVYDVQLSNDLDVKVDAGDGKVLLTEKADVGEDDKAEQGTENDANEGPEGSD